MEAYHLGIRLAARAGHERARKWRDGRKSPDYAAIDRLHRAGRRVIWLHAASLGEFEQGRPVLTEFRRQMPEWAVVVTFFSPSGYERCKDTDLAEVVAYLPPDHPDGAREWVERLRPSLAVFVKYEFWYYHLRALHDAGVPTVLVAASFRSDQPFFQWYGSAWRKMLGWFTHFAVQTEGDRHLLAKLDLHNVSVTGDPRLDRTAKLAETPFTDARLAEFCRPRPVLFAGSVWPPDVQLLAEVWPAFRGRWKLVLAPHQLREEELAAWQQRFGAERYSGSAGDADVLLLDTIGILSRAYRYGDAAYVGGAFSSGLHNTLEPLSYGLPVVFGPKYRKFPEAVAARESGGAFSVSKPDELRKVLEELSQPMARTKASRAQLAYRDAHRGAGRRTAALLARLVVFLLLSLPVTGQSWEAADRMEATLDGVFTKCHLMVALSGQEWRSGLCLAAAELEGGTTVSLEVQLVAGEEYTFIASTEERNNDLDLYLRNGEREIVAADDRADGTPVIQFSTENAGRYIIQLHLARATTPAAMVGLGMLSSSGRSLADSEYRRVSAQFTAAAGAVRAAGGASRFGAGRNEWCVYGYLLEEREGATISGLRLARGPNFIAATGTDDVKDLDLYLADEKLRVLRRDRDPDPYPMIEYNNQSDDPILLRVEVEKASRAGLILLGLFTR